MRAMHVCQGLSPTPPSPLPGLGVLLALPALVRRRRGAEAR
jgi:MYXO-CTERM domain-containing protein